MQISRGRRLQENLKGSLLVKRASVWIAGLLGCALIAPTGLRAQEIQVPLDENGRIHLVTVELARRLGLFTDVTGFTEARLFQRPDSTFILEITSTRRGGLLQRDRRPLSGSEAAEFRRDVAARVTARAPSAALDQGGRTKLLVGSTLLGLGYYGWATAMSFDPDNSQSAVAIYMVTAAGSFFAPLALTRNRTVPDAVATMALWGAMRGPVHGLVVSQLADAQSDKTKFAWSVAVGAAEGIAGGMLAQSLKMTPGHAEVTGVGGDIGLGAGWGIADLAGLNDRYRLVTVAQPGAGPYSYPVKERTLQSAAILAASGLGLAGGYLLGRTGEWTRGDAFVFRNVTAIGGLLGIAVGDLIQQPRVVTESQPGGGSYSYVDDGFSRTHSGAGLAGTAAGVMLGRALLKGRNFSTGQGTFLTLGPLAGGLLGVGIAYLATPEKQYNYDPSIPYRDPNDHSELYLTMGALGAAAGFAAMYPAMARQARATELGGNVQFSVNPLAIAHLAGGRSSRVMLGSVQYRF
jgi:hypothetical protein